MLLSDMKVLDLFSGISAPSVAWHPLGWETLAFAEIEKFPSAVLAHHYPDVPNLGDITKHSEWPDYEPDVIVGGSPCQSFSVAGLRKGLDDPRGNLALTYLAVVDQYRPRWVVWENVPGVLSIDGGRTFGAVLGGLAQLGYGFAYRVLDAFYFGCAIPRPRTFVVGHSRANWQKPAAVLLERAALKDSTDRSRAGARPHTLSTQNAGSRNARGNIIAEPDGLRGMTPRETERALGFPDCYTAIGTDGPRYKALGNSMAVPVVRWIGERIAMVEQCC